jgi:hypothetical protein
MFQLLHDDDSRAFAHHKAIAVPVEWPRGTLGLIVAPAERLHCGKSTDADLDNRRLGAPSEEDIGVAGFDDSPRFANGIVR